MIGRCCLYTCRARGRPVAVPLRPDPKQGKRQKPVPRPHPSTLARRRTACNTWMVVRRGRVALRCPGGFSKNRNNSDRNRIADSSACSAALSGLPSNLDRCERHPVPPQLSGRRDIPTHPLPISESTRPPYADLGTPLITVTLSLAGAELSATRCCTARLLLQQAATMRQAPRRRHTVKYLPRST